MYCSESLQHPLEVARASFSTDEFLDIMPSAASLSRTPRNQHRSDQCIRRQIFSYSKTKLTHPKDRLDACLGVLYSYEQRREHPLFHFWGVPIQVFDDVTGGDAIFLCWHHRRHVERDTMFPSWSWVGWKGRVWTEEKFSYLTMKSFAILVEARDGELVPLRDFVLREKRLSNGTFRNLESPRFLHFVAAVVDVELENIFLHTDQLKTQTKVYFSSPEGQACTEVPRQCGLHAKLKLSDQTENSNEVTAYAYVFQDAPLQAGEMCRGIVLCDERSWLRSQELNVILIRPVRSHYERVGLLRIRHQVQQPRGQREPDPVPPMLYEDRTGRVMDEVHLQWDNCLSWLREGKIDTIKLG
jgi:hypothetical protein